MLDSVGNTSIIGLKGKNLNLIQINFENWDASTRESPSGESSKCEIFGNFNKNQLKQNKKINNKILKNDTILNKKNKRSKNNQKIKDNKNKNNKYNLILNIFNEFKYSSPLYKEFPQFHAIEKNY